MMQGLNYQWVQFDSKNNYDVLRKCCSKHRKLYISAYFEYSISNDLGIVSFIIIWNIYFFRQKLTAL